MANLSWIKIIPYLVIAWLFWWALDSEYTRGTEFEIAKCESEKAKADIDAMKELGKLRKELDAERDKADTRATQIIGAYANEITKLHTDLTDAADHRLYITTKANSCEADRIAMSAADKNTGGDGGRIRFEIPEETSREIWRDAESVEKLEKKHNALARLIKSKPNCFEIVR